MSNKTITDLPIGKHETKSTFTAEQYAIRFKGLLQHCKQDFNQNAVLHADMYVSLFDYIHELENRIKQLEK